MIEIGGYRFPADRSYDTEHHLWAQHEPATGRVRVGMDVLGLEALGDLVAVALHPPGTRVSRGQALGTLEAAKMTGEIIAPVSGTVVEHNATVLRDPNRVNRSPYDDGWLLRLEPHNWPAEEVRLIGAGQLEAWVRREIQRYREQGWIQ